MKAASWFTRLPLALKVIVAFAGLFPALATIWAYTVGPIANGYRAEQAWRQSVTAALTCPPSDGADPPVGSLCAALLAEQAEAKALREDMDRLARQVRNLIRPSLIYKINPTSAPVSGFCTPDQECEFNILAARLPNAVQCDLIPELSTYHFHSEDLLSSREVQRIINDRGPRNITGEWSEVRITVVTPARFEDPAWFSFINYYHHCLGPDDEVVVSQESELIPVRIGTERPAD